MNDHAVEWGLTKEEAEQALWARLHIERMKREANARDRLAHAQHEDTRNEPDTR